jgi:hypothetical protein
MRKLRIILSLVLSAGVASIAQEAATSQSLPAPRVSDIKSADGTVLKGTYFSAGKPGPGVLLFHQSNRDRKSWDEMAAQLAKAAERAQMVSRRRRPTWKLASSS